MKKSLFLLALLLLMLMTPDAPAGAAPVLDPPDVCQSPENILPNCGFDNGLEGWQPFTEAGGANITVLQGGGECHAPLCPAAYIVAEGHFVGGLYQQVPVVNGNTYFANVVWLTFDSLSNDAAINSMVGGIGRRVGLDPFGGTDPRSPNIIWGPDNWRNDCKICDNQEVTATAQADLITLFIRIEDTWKIRATEQGHNIPPSKDQFWIDDVGLKLVAGEAVVLRDAVAEPPPTDTPAPPPAETSSLEPATDVPELPPTATPPPTGTPTPPPDAPGEVAQAESPPVELAAPLETPEPVKTIAPPPTLTPTTPPLPTDTPAARPRPTITNRLLRATPQPAPPMLSAGVLSITATTICAGGVLLMLMGVVMAGSIWLYRLGWGRIGHDEFNDPEEIMVEIVEDDRR